MKLNSSSEQIVLRHFRFKMVLCHFYFLNLYTHSIENTSMIQRFFTSILFVIFCLLLEDVHAQNYVRMQNNTVRINEASTWYDPGGLSDYTKGKHTTQTFCSASEQQLSVVFDAFDLASGDLLFVFDGENDAAYQLEKSPFSQHNIPKKLISKNTCLTFSLMAEKYNLSAKGWVATIEKTTQEPTSKRPMTQYNPEPADEAQLAPSVCSLNGFEARTKSSYTADQVDGRYVCDNSWQVHNNSWIKFKAPKEEFTLDVWVKNCAFKTQNQAIHGKETYYGQGVQLVIYKTDDFKYFEQMSTCYSPESPVHGSITASQLEIGSTYYVMIDGTSGDNCDYIFSSP